MAKSDSKPPDNPPVPPADPPTPLGGLMAGRIEQIGIPARSITAGFLPVALRPNTSLSPLLTITCFAEQGYMLEIKDPVGTPVWAVMLNGEGALDPEFGREYMAGYGD